MDAKHTTCMLQGRILQAARRFVLHFCARYAGFRQVLLLGADCRARRHGGEGAWRARDGSNYLQPAPRPPRRNGLRDGLR
ncbi:hypothetical protein EFP20_18340 [Burkholderia glumae]|nr:hypothetical protein EFP20_18340 [Burkholderia glumae]